MTFSTDAEIVEFPVADASETWPVASAPDGPVSDGTAAGNGEAAAAGGSSSEQRPPLFIGSAKPHASEGGEQQFQREDRWAPSGSLRQLEPELHEVLLAEALPRCNIPPRTAPDPPPPRHTEVPGPFTTEQLIPTETVERIIAHRKQFQLSLERSARANGWQEASKLRPEAEYFSEEQTLNPCGRGFTWRFHKPTELWHAVQPSSYREVFGEEFPDDPPECGGINVENYLADTERLDMPDRQVASWVAHGFPGSKANRHAVLGRPHVGALKEPQWLKDCHERDVKAGFVTTGFELPEFWPCTLDCVNVVVQHGKGRLCIDKTIELFAYVDSYNSAIDLLEAENRMKMVSVKTLTRGAAILRAAGAEVLLAKFDLQAFFRMHSKQRADINQSARCFEDGFGSDKRVNFGERDAPDHCGRESNGICFFVRTELRRLEREYPTRCPKIEKWLAMRLALAKEAGEESDPDFVWVVTFFFLYYVDDAGLSCFNDLLFNRKGEPVFVLRFGADGTISRVHQRRAELYFAASTGTADHYGHGTPEKKRSYPALELEFLGDECDIVGDTRSMPAWKTKEYHELLKGIVASRAMPNGRKKTLRADFKELVHKLLHASGVYPLGRQRLHYCLKELRTSAGDAETPPDKFIFPAGDAERELGWWDAQLAKGESPRVPFASRYSFPATNSESTIVFYGDASRELDDPDKVSGYGAWCVIGGTFYYFWGEWRREELLRFSINVLEAKTRNDGLIAFVRLARQLGCSATHALCFTDNTAAEHTAERGRTGSDAMQALAQAWQDELVASGVHAATERVTSVDNDFADMLSRGAEQEVLRIVVSAGLKFRRIFLDPDVRDTSWIPSSVLAARPQ